MPEIVAKMVCELCITIRALLQAYSSVRKTRPPKGKHFYEPKHMDGKRADA